MNRWKYTATCHSLYKTLSYSSMTIFISFLNRTVDDDSVTREQLDPVARKYWIHHTPTHFSRCFLFWTACVKPVLRLWLIIRQPFVTENKLMSDFAQISNWQISRKSLIANRATSSRHQYHQLEGNIFTGLQETSITVVLFFFQLSLQ